MLRDAGFKGSGTTLRRINEPIVNVFNVQGSASRTGCYINQGAHLLLLPKLYEREYETSKFPANACIFKERFKPGATHWEMQGRWPYGNTEEEMEASAMQMGDKWAREGYLFFEKYREYPADFLTVINAAAAKKSLKGRLYEYAQLAIVLEEYEKSEHFTLEALARCPATAPAYKAKLELLLKKIRDLKSQRR